MVRYFYDCSLKENAVVIQRQTGYQSLRIAFHRTVRVPDNEDVCALPPDLGLFPLHKVKDFAATLPRTMVAKGGLVMPMHSKFWLPVRSICKHLITVHEAMWVSFRAETPFAIKLYVGGVNAVSGVPYKETDTIKARQSMLRANPQNIQEYMVVPSQL